MTRLTKPITRNLDVLPHGGLVVSMHPNGLLSFRESRSRREYYLPVLTAYRMAIDADRLDRKRGNK